MERANEEKLDALGEALKAVYKTPLEEETPIELDDLLDRLAAEPSKPKKA